MGDGHTYVTFSVSLIDWSSYILGSKVLCMFCFETCSTEGRGGEKAGSAKFQKNTQNLLAKKYLDPSTHEGEGVNKSR